MIKAAKFGPTNGGSYLDQARERWGDKLPEWVSVLAQRTDQAGNQGTIAKQLDLNSAAVVSAVLNNKYAGRLDRIEAKVRGAFMSSTVDCPVQGVIGRDHCASDQTLKASSASPLRVKLRRACPLCPNFMGAKT